MASMHWKGTGACDSSSRSSPTFRPVSLYISFHFCSKESSQPSREPVALLCPQSPAADGRSALAGEAARVAQGQQLSLVGGGRQAGGQADAALRVSPPHLGRVAPGTRQQRHIHQHDADKGAPLAC
eukprot:761211-Hanusia_phi.AAC.2